MATPRRSFGRILLGLPHNAQDFPAIELAGELAECLGAQFFGAFIVEPAILGLGGIPGAQQLKSVTAGWQPIEGDSLARDIQEAAEVAHRRFSAIAERLNIETAFQLAHGLTAEIVASLASENDIVAMIEPRHPADRITRQFLSFMEAAFQATSSVMFVPSRVVRKEGPIVVVAAGSGDKAIDLGADMAAAMHEQLIAVNMAAEPIAHPALAPGGSIKSRVISAPRALSIEGRVVAALAGVRERMIVACRTTLDSAQSRAVADKRGVPVLVTGSIC